MTTEEFLKQGNAICADFDQAMEEANAEMSSNPNPSADEIGAYIEDDWAPNVQAAIDDLEKLIPPEDLEGDVDSYLEDSQAVLDDLVDAAASDPESVFAGEGDPFADINAQATEIGLTTCA